MGTTLSSQLYKYGYNDNDNSEVGGRITTLDWDGYGDIDTEASECSDDDGEDKYYGEELPSPVTKKRKPFIKSRKRKRENQHHFHPPSSNHESGGANEKPSSKKLDIAGGIQVEIINDPDGGLVYGCNLCKNKFSNRGNVNWHIKTVHIGVKKYSCPTCPKRFTTSQHLKVHSYIHSGMMPYKCASCPKSFRSRSNLNVHMKTIHLGLKQQCGFCPKAYNLRRDLDNHVRRCHDPHNQRLDQTQAVPQPTNPAASVKGTEICDDESLKSNLKDVDKTDGITVDVRQKAESSWMPNTGTKYAPLNLKFPKLVLTRCDNNWGFLKQVGLSSSFSSHHTQEDGSKIKKKTIETSQLELAENVQVERSTDGKEGTVYRCKLCQRPFSIRINATRHVRALHFGEKSFSCPKCPKTFGYSYEVRNHMVTHTGLMPYKCPLCKLRFSHPGNMKRHVKYHSGLKPFKCPAPGCSRTFKEKYEWKRHVERFHKKNS